MSIRKKLLLMLLSFTALVLTVLAGCMGEMGAEEFLTNQGALNQYVVYYGNGGTFDGKDDIFTKTIHYAPDSYVIGDFSAVRNISVSKTDYVFDGWYYVELGADDKPLLDADGNITLSSIPVDFTKKIQENEKWYIGASWVADVKLEIKLVTDDGGKMTASDGTEYENGALLTTRSFPNGVAVMDTAAPVKSTDYTFTQFFYDEGCTQRVTANIPQPEGTDAENPVIYAQYLKGDWEIVRTASNVRSMLFSPGGKNYWIATMTEEKVIDCSSISLSLRTGEFSARIEGNGYTLKGITITNTLQSAGAEYSMFGIMTEDTAISNLKFENLTINATTARTASIYAICCSAEGAALKNLSFENVKLNITSGVAITNIPELNEGHDTSNWIFGGEGTDAQFLGKYTGVTLDGATLVIKNTEYNFGNE